MRKLALLTMIASIDLLSHDVPAQTITSVNSLTLRIEEGGTVIVDVNVKRKAGSTPNYIGGPTYSITVVAIPFEFSKECNVNSGNVRVAPLATGPDYSLLTVLAPTTLSDLTWRMENCVKLTETEGRAKLTLPLAYKQMSERELLSLPFTVSSWDVYIILPRKYPETEVSYRPHLLTSLDEFTYLLTADNSTANKVDQIWLVFPDPSKRTFEIAQIIVAFMIGTFTSLFQIPIVKKRNLGVVLAILVSSLAIVALAAYYTFVLARNIEFAAWAAIVIPHALFGLVASIYVLLARTREANVVGRIEIDGESAVFCNVELFEVSRPIPRKVARTDLLSNGMYQLAVWLRKGDRLFELRAQAKGTDEKKSEKFALIKGDKHSVLTIALQRKPLVHTTQHGGLLGS